MWRPPLPGEVSVTAWSGGRPVARRLQLLAVFVAALVPRLLTVGRFLTTDEGIWIFRAMGFSDALLELRLSDATASQGGPATMPGGPTMWLGSLGRLVWSVGQDLGIVGDDRSFVSMSGLGTAQAMVAIATSLLIVLVVVLVDRWGGWGAAAVTALLLIGEPWLVGLGSILHTDELTALFATAGLLLLSLAFDVPDRGRVSRPVLTAGLAGFLVMLAPLTKVIGLAFGIGAAAVVVWSLWRDWGRTDDEGRALTGLRAKQVAAAAVGVVVAIPLMWPALLADPSTQIAALADSIELGSRGQQQFFLGEIVRTPGPTYYGVALPLRVTPWMLVAVVVAVPLGLAFRATRARVLWTLVWTVAPAVTITRSALQYDRYVLLVLVPLTVLAGVAIGPHVERLLARQAPLRGAAAAVAGAVAIYVAMVSPWGLLYFNPMLGGGETAEDALLVGWGEGLTQALASIKRMEGGDCAGVTVAGSRTNILGVRALPAPADVFGMSCTTLPRKGEEPDYIIDYINARQRMSERQRREALAGREAVETIEIRGIPVATIYR